ncbi:MAG: YraN family protein [Nitrospina sp.]|nr:YraN family protein [Nitrospina sp.]
MTFKRKKFGEAGEALAVQYLKGRKYRILETNFRTPSGEIDIVAEQGGVLVFVEVKSRAGGEYGSPLSAVNTAKQKKLVQMAQRFRARHNLWDQDCRFDVVAVSGEPEDPATWQVELVPNAFQWK